MKKYKIDMALCAVVVGLGLAANAASYVWSGAANDGNKWTTPENWTVGGKPATSVPGSASGDSVIFQDLNAVEGGAVVIDLAGMTQIKTVTFNGMLTPYQLGTNSTQYLKLESGATVQVSSGVTVDQKVLCFQTIAGGAITVRNDSSAKFTFGDLRKTGGNPTYKFYGAGTIEMDGTTTFDQVSNFSFYNTGLFILGDKSTASDSRILQLSIYSISGATHKIEIPQGRYLNTTGGGWSSLIADAQENTRIYGPGIIVARYHFNCSTKESQEYSANFQVSSGKTLTIESYIRYRSGDMAPWGGPGVFGAGTLYLCSSNNLPGQARIHGAGGTLAVDKIGMKHCQPDESNLGTGDGIRFMQSGTLEYRGEGPETTDRDLVISNNTFKVIATLANAGGDTLTWTGRLLHMFTAQEGHGGRLRLQASKSPIVFDGSFEEGKPWELEIAGSSEVRLTYDLGATRDDIPIILNGGTLAVSADVDCSSRIQVAGAGSAIKVAENCDYELDAIPSIVDGTANLNIVLPESSSLKIKGKSTTRLDNINVNGNPAKLDENGKVVRDLATYATKTWISVTNGGRWSEDDNWLDASLPVDYDSVVVSNSFNSSPTYTITLDQPAKVQGIKTLTTNSGRQTISGSETLTLAAGGYIAHTNMTTTSSGHTGYDGGPLDFDVPLHLESSQRWLLGSKRGWGATDSASVRNFTKDISSEVDINWQLLGYARYLFKTGSSENFKGTATVGTFINFYGTNQFHRLGTKGITMYNRVLTDEEAVAAGTTRLSPGLTYRFLKNEYEATVTTPIAIDINAAVNGSRTGWSYEYAPICMHIDESSQQGEPHVLTFTGGLSGSFSGSSLLFSQSVSAYQPVTASHGYYPDDQRIVLAGDSSGLSSETAVRTSTMIELAHPHALGRNNSRNVICGADGYWGNQRFSTVQGVSLRPGLSMSGTVSAGPTSDTNGAQNRNAYMQVGSAATSSSDGATTALFSGAVTGGQGFRLRLSAAEGTEARFTGKVTASVVSAVINRGGGDHLDLVGGGDITLVNSSNSIGTNLCVRSGRLVLEKNGAAGTKPIWLGGFVPTLAETKEVRCVNANVDFSVGISDVTEGSKTIKGKRLTISGSNVPVIDGVTVVAGDYVLVNRPAATSENGIWKVTDNPKVWERPDEIDEPDDIVGKVGLRVKVKEGKRFGGKAFMLVYDPCCWRTSAEQYKAENDHFATGNCVPVFHQENAAEPNVAVLTGVDGLTLTCGIDVTDNASTGVSVIGSKIEGSTTGFSGAIRLSKDVTLAAAKNSTVNFIGTISGNGDIIGGGEGVSDISGAMVSIADDNGFVFKSGTLKAAVSQFENRKLTWKRNVIDDVETTGVLAVDGALDFTSLDCDFSSFELSRTAGDDRRSERKWCIATATGAITLPSGLKMPQGWTLTAENGTVYANYTPVGTVILLR